MQTCLAWDTIYEPSHDRVVTPVSRQSSVINLKIRDEIPQRGEAILTAVVDAYNQSAIERKNSIAMKTLEFIESRLKNVGAQLDSVEGGIQRYRDKAGIVDISEQSRLYLQSIEDLITAQQRERDFLKEEQELREKRRQQALADLVFDEQMRARRQQGVREEIQALEDYVKKAKEINKELENALQDARQIARIWGDSGT